MEENDAETLKDRADRDHAENAAEIARWRDERLFVHVASDVAAIVGVERAGNRTFRTAACVAAEAVADAEIAADKIFAERLRGRDERIVPVP